MRLFAKVIGDYYVISVRWFCTIWSKVAKWIYIVMQKLLGGLWCQIVHEIIMMTLLANHWHRLRIVVSGNIFSAYFLQSTSVHSFILWLYIKIMLILFQGDQGPRGNPGELGAPGDRVRKLIIRINPLHPNICMYILYSVLYTVPKGRICFAIKSLVIISFIHTTLVFDSGLILYGENRC